jgi:hypothetical protein
MIHTLEKYVEVKTESLLLSTNKHFVVHIVFSEKLGTIHKKIVLADPGRSHALDMKL